jgi:EmrB/QacA subfamily drug resistance transporter
MTAQPVDYSRKWYVMAAIGAATFLETIDTSAVNLALPTLVRELDTTFAMVQWVVLAFVLTQATLMLVVGRLGDMLGKKRIFVTGFAVAGIGALLCGLAPGIGWLIGFRMVQAVGTAMALALSMGIATEAFPPHERGKALGAIGSIVSVGIVIGPLLGGVLLDALSWRWIFFSVVPFAVIGLPIALRYLPDTEPTTRERFDYVGAFLFFCSLLAFLLATTFGQRSGYGQPGILALLGTSALFLLIFVFVEWRIDQPVVDLDLFRNSGFSLNLLLRFLSFIIYVGLLLLLPFYLENVLGYAPRQVGLLLTVIPIAFGLVAPFAGTLADRFGTHPVAMTGLVLLLGGCFALSTLDAQTTTLGYVLRLLPVGAGMGIFQSPNNSVIMGNAPRARLGMASSLLSVIRTLGRSAGIALLGALWAGRVLTYAGSSVADATNAPIAAQVAGFQDAFLAAGALVLLALALNAFEWQRSRRAQPVAPVSPQTGA